MTFFDEVLTKEIKNVAIVGHMRPDGDCAGSVTGLYHFIRDNYPDISTDPYLEELPDNIMFLSENTPVLMEYTGKTYDLCICLDCSDMDRIGAGKEAFLKSKTKVCIDHHKTNEGFCNRNVIDEHISSTCELLTKLCGNEQIGYETALRFYTGIVHDTGCFQYDCTSPETYRRAADLIEKGVPFSDIIRESFTMKSFKEIRLISDVISKAVFYKDEGFMYADASLDFQKEHDVTVKDLGIVVSSLNEIRGAEAVLFIYQLDDGTWKGSLRSKTKADVSEIAAFFGGGGHIKAAGFGVEDYPEKAVETVRKLLKEQLSER